MRRAAPALLVLVALTLPSAAWAGQARPQREEQRLYVQAQRALNAARWAEAVDLFSRLAELDVRRRDAALYWRGYAHNRLGNRDAALRSLAELRSTYPRSRYARQGRALELEIRRDGGEAVEPQAQDDEQLRLMALQGLMRSDPDRAMPMLEQLLRGAAAPRVKARALFLLAQSSRPEAQQLIVDVARGSVSPALQERAIGYLVARGTPETRAVVRNAYRDAADRVLKRRIVRGLARVGERDLLAELAAEETDPVLKRDISTLLTRRRR